MSSGGYINTSQVASGGSSVAVRYHNDCDYRFGRSVHHRLLSEPATVHWAGFRSDTLTLQKQGWQIAVDEDVASGRVRLLLKHSGLKLHALTHETEFMYRDRMYGSYNRPPEFHVVAAAETFRTQHIGNIDFAKFREIDATPQYIDSEIKSLEDFRIFAPRASETITKEDIIVEPETVQSMLERIREMQEPEQARLREKQRRALAAGEEVRHVHAQVISLAERRAA